MTWRRGEKLPHVHCRTWDWVEVIAIQVTSSHEGPSGLNNVVVVAMDYYVHMYS
jgi:hypothetical protein